VCPASCRRLRLPRLRFAALLSTSIALACGGGAAPGALQPADVAALEAAVAQHPDDPAANLRLAKAYYAAQRFADARHALETAVRAAPANEEARVYLGFTYEGLTQYDSARAVYTQLLASRPRRSLRQLVAGRLTLLAHKELQLAARQAIARESLLARTPPGPNTVAVMPFRYVGSDTAYRPLERGLAALVVTDLSRVHALQLVERDRLQVLLDELALAETGLVDPATGARSGRLVQAAEVVQGQFELGPAAALRLDATVVRATDAQVAATGSRADRLEALFDVEKAVVFQLLEKLGLTLTPGERVAISERPTRDIQAFLLYSRGLEAEDRGDFAAATQAFGSAAQRDPGFRAASDRAATTQAARTASTTAPADIAAAVGGGSGAGGQAAGATQGALLTAINGTVPTGAALLQTVSTAAALTVPPADATAQTVSTGGQPTIPTNPNPICEAATCDGPARAALIGTVFIILRRP
jgi:tetratricopeptide (TPR) repeat protein